MWSALAQGAMKSAGKIAAAKAKDVATSKAKNFVTGKGKGKGGALVKAGGQKPTKVDPSNLMGRQVGGDKGGVDIPASRQTINVTASGSDSPVGSGGGSGDIKIVQDISIAVSAIAESMKSGLVLKEKAKKKAARAAEEQKRDALEDKTEAKKPKKEKKGKGLSFKVPKIGMLEGVLGFITKFIFGTTYQFWEFQQFSYSANNDFLEFQILFFCTKNALLTFKHIIFCANNQFWNFIFCNKSIVGAPKRIRGHLSA